MEWGVPAYVDVMAQVFTYFGHVVYAFMQTPVPIMPEKGAS